ACAAVQLRRAQPAVERNSSGKGEGVATPPRRLRKTLMHLPSDASQWSERNVAKTHYLPAMWPACAFRQKGEKNATGARAGGGGGRWGRGGDSPRGAGHGNPWVVLEVALRTRPRCGSRADHHVLGIRRAPWCPAGRG